MRVIRPAQQERVNGPNHELKGKEAPAGVRPTARQPENRQPEGVRAAAAGPAGVKSC